MNHGFSDYDVRMIFEFARVAMADAEMFDELLELLDVSDFEGNELRSALQKYMDDEIPNSYEGYAERELRDIVEIEDPAEPHIDGCQFGDNWKECPACIEQHNSTCDEKDRIEV